ncbi:MAG: CpaD family pilus assembly lipoprotein [Sneathiella sp.]
MTFTVISKAGLLGLSLVMGLSACGAPRDPETGELALRANPQTAMMTKQINVQKLTPTFVVKFEPEKSVFSELEKGRLLGFIQAQGAEFGDVLQLELPPFSDAAGMNEERFGAIGGFLQDEGFTVEPKLARDGLENSLRVYFTKYVATVDPKCSRGWTRPKGQEYESLPLEHMGCATASNLTQMLANPKDLIEPGTMGPYDGARAALSILKYQAGAAGGGKSKSKSGGSGKSGGGGKK